MGQGKSKPVTHVANCYHEDILACVKANRIEVYEEKTGFEAKVGGKVVFPAKAGLARNTHRKKIHVTQDPGFTTIKPGCYFGFAESGHDGNVFVTIQIGSEILHSNVQVYNNSNVLVDNEGSLRNVKHKKIWIDTSGEKHTVAIPAKSQELLKERLEKKAKGFRRVSVKNKDAEVISSAKGLMKNHDPVEGGPCTKSFCLELQSAEDTRATETLRRYLDKGKVKKYFGTEGNGEGQLKAPCGIHSTASDNIVVADTFNHRIQIFDVNGNVKGVYGSEGRSEGQFNQVAGVCVTAQECIIASDFGNDRIQILDEHGKFVLKFGTNGSGDGELSFPWGVATDDEGLIYVCDHDNNRVQVFSENGKFVRKFGSDQYLSVASGDRVVVSDPGNNRVEVFDLYGRHLFQFGTEGTKESQFKNPRGIATDHHGNIIICDSGNHRVQIFTRGGAFVTCFGSEGSEPGQMREPEGVCLLSDGGIAITDRLNHRVQIF